MSRTLLISGPCSPRNPPAADSQLHLARSVLRASLSCEKSTIYANPVYLSSANKLCWMLQSSAFTSASLWAWHTEVTGAAESASWDIKAFHFSPAEFGSQKRFSQIGFRESKLHTFRINSSLADFLALECWARGRSVPQKRPLLVWWILCRSYVKISRIWAQFSVQGEE